jgi:NADH-quinone oxidoreductase subunit I
MSFPGKGLVKGLAVTMRNMTRRSVTAQYPDALPELPPRSRGVIALIEENCTVCMLCARECPAWCIYIDSHKDTVPAATEGGRDKSRNVLDRFAIDFSICMYCSICVEVCPFDALHWSPEFEYAELDIRDLTHEKDRLREWMWTVPAPPALDEGAEQPKELGVAEKAAAKTAQEAATRPPADAPPGNQSGSSVAGRPDPSAPGGTPASGRADESSGEDPA